MIACVQLFCFCCLFVCLFFLLNEPSWKQCKIYYITSAMILRLLKSTYTFIRIHTIKFLMQGFHLRPEAGRFVRSFAIPSSVLFFLLLYYTFFLLRHLMNIIKPMKILLLPFSLPLPLPTDHFHSPVIYFLQRI